MKKLCLIILAVSLTAVPLYSFPFGPSPGVQRSSAARSTPPPARARSQNSGTLRTPNAQAGTNSLPKPRIVNSRYAGKTYPVERLPKKMQSKYPKSVEFDKDGYPNFRPYTKKEVKIPNLTGNYASDFYKANKAAGFNRTPEGYTWHHHQDGVRMQLVPSDLHRAVKHTGGASVLRSTNN